MPAFICDCVKLVVGGFDEGGLEIWRERWDADDTEPISDGSV
jgi:hypothetical protein